MKVQDGTQRIRLAQINIAYLKRQIDIVKGLMKRYDYHGAISIFDEIIKYRLS